MGGVFLELHRVPLRSFYSPVSSLAPYSRRGILRCGGFSSSKLPIISYRDISLAGHRRDHSFSVPELAASRPCNFRLKTEIGDRWRDAAAPAGQAAADAGSGDGLHRDSDCGSATSVSFRRWNRMDPGRTSLHLAD